MQLSHIYSHSFPSRCITFISLFTASACFGHRLCSSSKCYKLLRLWSFVLYGESSREHRCAFWGISWVYSPFGIIPTIIHDVILIHLIFRRYKMLAMKHMFIKIKKYKTEKSDKIRWNCFMSRDISENTMATLRGERPRNRTSVPGRGRVVILPDTVTGHALPSPPSQRTPGVARFQAATAV